MLEIASKNRFASLARKFALVALAGLSLAGAASASEGEGMASANIRVDDTAQLQRGARLFFNYCSGCHGLQYMRYSRIGEDLKIDEKEIASSLIFTGAKIGDKAVSHMPAGEAAAWFGKAPPDLSLEARAKGPDWIYNYLKSFYLDPSRPVGWNNTVFPNASMPNALWALQGLQVAVKHPAEAGHEAGIEKLEIKTPGSQTPEQYDQTVRDITAFLTYVGEPAALKRQAIGVWVLLYLAFFTFIAYLLKHEYWKDVH
ncbi:MAG TPA: cytochrome c1 [Rhodanobacteraceae bacterium]|nr:cytochrome c1 [Rhodanobacteraceae bacterium]